MLARFVIATGFVALVPLAASATTPFSDYCEGNICFQRKVSMACMTPSARQLMREIADRFGKIEIASACDGRHARRSAHYVGKAFDFRPYNAARGDVIAFLKAAPHVGGVGTYHNGLIHADVADRKMAWFGSGRGRVVWPIGAGTIVKSPDEAPAAQASAFAFPFNLWGRQAAPEGEKVIASAAPAGPGAEVAAASAASTAPPLPPRRPAILAAMTAEQAAEVAPASQGEASAVGTSAFGDIAPAAVPSAILSVPGPAVAAFGMAPPEPQRGAPAPAAAPVPGFVVVGGERPTPAPTQKGFGADESLFSARPLAQHTQPGFNMAAYSPSLISPPRTPY